VTPGGRALHVVKVSSGGEEGERTHPCILMYAREHPDEQDSSWAVAGAMRRVLADDEKAREFRKRCTFMFIPILDMDCANKGGHDGIVGTFRGDQASRESVGYGGYFQDWIADGKPLDLVFDFHNMESGEGEHLVPPTFPGFGSPYLAPARALHGDITEAVQSQGYEVKTTPWYSAATEERLGGWLNKYFGTLFMPYELNLQEEKQHLRCEDLQALGIAITATAVKRLQGTEGQKDVANAAAVREKFLGTLRKIDPAVRARSNVFSVDKQVTERMRTDALLQAMGSGGK
jgi:hypothetical protein